MRTGGSRRPSESFLLLNESQRAARLGRPLLGCELSDPHPVGSGSGEYHVSTAITPSLSHFSLAEIQRHVVVVVPGISLVEPRLASLVPVIAGSIREIAHL